MYNAKEKKSEDTTLCDKVCQWLATGRWFSLGATVSSINETDRSDITIVESGVKHHNPNPINTKVVIRSRNLKKNRKTMAKKRTKGQTMIPKTLDRKLKIEQHEPH
jgi:hypothetical protein